MQIKQLSWIIQCLKLICVKGEFYKRTRIEKVMNLWFWNAYLMEAKLLVKLYIGKTLDLIYACLIRNPWFQLIQNKEVLLKYEMKLKVNVKTSCHYYTCALHVNQFTNTLHMCFVLILLAFNSIAPFLLLVLFLWYS